MLPQIAARFGEQLPVPRSRIQFLKDGEVFDNGNGEKSRIMFTPGHQPSGLVIFEEKNKGLFINDLVGNYFADADFSLVLTPPRSDVLKAREALMKFTVMDIRRLYMGHYGISDKPLEVIHRTLDGIQRITDIADRCIREGKPGEIESRVLASKMPEVEKLRKTRGEVLYEYTKNELITHHSTYFAEYLFCFVFGYLFCTDRQFWDAIERHAFSALALATVTTAALAYLELSKSMPAIGYSVERSGALALRTLCGWCWIITFLGMARKFPSFSNRFLSYANEALLPFYVLHHMGVIGVGFYVIRWDIPVLAKYLLIIVMSFAIIMLLYGFVVNRTNVTRFLFGMRTKRRASHTVTAD